MAKALDEENFGWYFCPICKELEAMNHFAGQYSLPDLSSLEMEPLFLLEVSNGDMIWWEVSRKYHKTEDEALARERQITEEINKSPEKHVYTEIDGPRCDGCHTLYLHGKKEQPNPDKVFTVNSASDALFQQIAATIDNNPKPADPTASSIS